ncbi:MAG TPA: VOC family protein, partial [Thermoleophilaceae bacterium]
MAYRLLSQLVHVELNTPTLAESVEFAVDVLGLDVVEEAGDSVYLRCWGDYYAHSLILTAAEEPGLAHAAWRTDGAEQLEEAVRNVEAAGTYGEWIESSMGHARA